MTDQFQIGDEEHKVRLDRYLQEKYPELSRSSIQKSITQKRVRVNGETVKAGYSLRHGDRIEVEREEEKTVEGLIEEAGEVNVLYEDEHVIAIDKASGLLSHPNPGQNNGSVLNLLKHQGYALKGGDDPLREGLIHRLDRETSGVMLLAKSEESHTAFQNAFKERQVKKQYECLAYGELRRMEFHCDLALSRHPHRRNSQCVDPEGRSALTHFKVIERFSDRHAWIEARPLTGRTHQIRVHLQAMDLCVLGDAIYSPPHMKQKKEIAKVARMMLHCRSLCLEHPLLKSELRIESPLPSDFLEQVERLKQA